MITEINRKDSKTFLKFFKENFPPLVMFANKYLKNESLATDVAQESFIKLWHCNNEFSSIEKIRGFLYITAKNLSLNHIKHERIVSSWANYSLKEQEIFTRDNIIEQETYRLLHLAIDQLAPQSKRIILLSLQGFTNQEIADKIGISINTVGTLKQNAYKKLKGLLKEHFYLLFLYF